MVVLIYNFFILRNANILFFLVDVNCLFNDSFHVEAAETKQQFESGWFANPIFVNGKYPDIMRQKVKSNSVSVLPNLMLKFVFYLD